ncbi:uncharacterized protein LOC132039454 [Lycium ferocissimum]|uniref:uncharacterized protein LOC132039454 n=1 Tax=Lycium ferocissimum TaxID=112874 RepID=UPI0028149B43|nr:uncharacterized protein LOC132039454 [Lycium ferocissimum]
MKKSSSDGEFCHKHTKEKIVVVKGPTAAGKFKFSIDLATHFFPKIINSDKMQVYKGLDMYTNKIPRPDRRVPHHMLGDFASEEIRHFLWVDEPLDRYVLKRSIDHMRNSGLWEELGEEYFQYKGFSGQNSVSMKKVINVAIQYWRCLERFEREESKLQRQREDGREPPKFRRPKVGKNRLNQPRRS